MEQLIRVAKQHFEAQQSIDTNTLVELIEKAKADPSIESVEPNAWEIAKGVLAQDDVLSFESIYAFLNKIFPDCFPSTDADQCSAEPANMSPLDSRTRTNKLTLGRSARGSAAEGARLRQRQFVGLSDAQIDALANESRNETLGSISAYATTRIRTTPPRPTVITDTDYFPSSR
ncbi:hypothetical protein FB639_002910, partial [Coemansia asiatica]